MRNNQGDDGLFTISRCAALSTLVLLNNSSDTSTIDGQPIRSPDEDSATND